MFLDGLKPVWNVLSLHFVAGLHLIARKATVWRPAIASRVSYHCTWTALHDLPQHPNIHSNCVVSPTLRRSTLTVLHYSCSTHFNSTTQCIAVWTFNTTQVQCVYVNLLHSSVCCCEFSYYVSRTLRNLNVHHLWMDDPWARLVWMMEGSVVMNQLEQRQGLDRVTPSWRNILTTLCRVWMYSNKLPPKLQSPQWSLTMA